MTSIKSEIRGAGLLGPHATAEYKMLQAGQPLILTREPTNQKDPNAVIARTVFLVPVGYVARQQALELSPKLAAGAKWCAYVVQPGAYAKWADCKLQTLESARAEEEFVVAARTFGASDNVIQAALLGRYNDDPGVRD